MACAADGLCGFAILQMRKCMTQVSRYLEAVRQRVIVFDGAMGRLDDPESGAGAVDYGGERTEGCTTKSW